MLCKEGVTEPVNLLVRSVLCIFFYALVLSHPVLSRLPNSNAMQSSSLSSRLFRAQIVNVKVQLVALVYMPLWLFRGAIDLVWV